MQSFALAALGILLLAGEYILHSFADQVPSAALILHRIGRPEIQMIALIATGGVIASAVAVLVARDPRCLTLHHFALFALFTIALFAAATNFDAASIRADATVFCSGIALAYAVSTFRPGRADALAFAAVQLAWCPIHFVGLVRPLVVGPIYHGTVRQSGIWSSPNIHGLIMGTMVVVSVAILAAAPASASLARLQRCASWAAGVCSLNGLLFSFSRGAWVATTLGLIWLYAEQRMRSSVSRGAFRLHPTRLAIMAASTAAILACIPDEILPLKARLSSFWNENDLSIQNRFAAWDAGIQMVRDRPLLGYRWTPLEEVYGAWYAPARIEDYGAIHTNDWVTVGANGGLGVVAFFVSLTGGILFGNPRRRSYESSSFPTLPLNINADWGPCRRACLLTLLVGIGFDGGLYCVPIAAPLWYLIGSEISKSVPAS